MKFNSWMKTIGGLTLPFIAREQSTLASIMAASTHQVPYFGDGRSRSHKQQIRKIKKAQRRRAYYKSLRR